MKSKPTSAPSIEIRTVVRDRLVIRGDADLKNELKAKKERLKKRGKKLSPKKFKVKEPPRALERRYLKEISRFVRLANTLVSEILKPELERIVDQAAATRPTADSNFFVRLDTYPETIARLIATIRATFFGEISEAEIAVMAEKFAEQINDFNSREVSRVFAKALGVDVVVSEAWLKPEIDSFVQENVSLIKSIPENYLKEVEELVQREVRAGKRATEIQGMIQERFGVASSKAKLIAQDQVGKFNGNLTRLRQQDIGLKRYRWRTSKDEKVRPDHARLEGDVFSWDDPPVTNQRTGARNHPGEDIRCRCTAEPLIEDLIE